LYAPAGYRSQTVTTIDNRLKLDVLAINQFLKGRGMRIAGGYGAIKDQTFRIAHMAEIQLADIESLLRALDEYLAQIRS
jgi:aspartate aminotransferase-like enzyme